MRCMAALPSEPFQRLLRVGQTALKVAWKASLVGVLLYYS